MTPNFKNPPRRSGKHLDFIRSLPCCLCGAPAEASHTRHTDLARGKSSSLGMRADDFDCVPLCPAHHRLSPDALHNTGNESYWWRQRGIDPYALAAALEKVSGDHEKGLEIVARYRGKR